MRPLLKSSVERVLSRLGYQLRCVRDIPPLLWKEDDGLKLTFHDAILRRIHEKNDEELLFVQVGAFDGVSCDPLREFVLRYGWRGMLLEPQPEPYSRLCKNYGSSDRLIFKNAAVGRVVGEMPLYTVDAANLPAWCGGLAGFDPSTIRKHEHLVPGISERIVEIRVPTVTFDTLLDELGCSELDLLQVDTEGFDADVIEMFPFERMKPKIIHFERKHLSSKRLNECLTHLQAFGYRFAFDGGEDMLACLVAAELANVPDSPIAAGRLS